MYKVNSVATGRNIKKACIDNNLKPEDLSRLLDTSLATPYQWFNGKMMPKLDHFVSLSRLLGCKIDDLLVIEED